MEGDTIIVRQQPSRPAWDAWIEIHYLMFKVFGTRSRPAWDAWIEMPRMSLKKWYSLRRVPHGTRGLKLGCTMLILTVSSRVPHGTRGLK